MPLYEYCCEACEATFEARLARSDSPDPSCPSCGTGESVTRLFSTFAVPSSGDYSGRRSVDVPPCQGGTAPGCGSCEVAS